MRCRKCQGFMQHDLEYDALEGAMLSYSRCLICGKREFDPIMGKPIQVVKGQVYDPRA